MPRYAFEQLGLHRVYAYVLAFNPPARRAFEKAGFALEGTLRDDRRVDRRLRRQLSAGAAGVRAVLHDFFHPDLSLDTQALLRSAYGVLMMLTLLQALPEARRFFLSERWGGYAKSSRDVDAVQNPFVMRAAHGRLARRRRLLIALGWWSPWAALVNLVLCRYFFIHMRWKGILRGMGAPGFMAYWTGLAVFLLEYTVALRAGPPAASRCWSLQVDLALIMLSAGVYKFTAGYPRNHGMELGLCNPMWGYWWRRYADASAEQLRLLDDEPAGVGNRGRRRAADAHPADARAWRVAAHPQLPVHPHADPSRVPLRDGDRLRPAVRRRPAALVDGWIAGWSLRLPLPLSPTGASRRGRESACCAVALWTYLALLPFAHAGLYYNFYARRRCLALLQRALERYTNLFGIIIWRVFSVDLVNFFIRVWREPRAGGDTACRSSQLGAWPRFNHVGEMICLTSLFTTLKYYPSNDAIFRERLLRYARTLPRARRRPCGVSNTSAWSRRHDALRLGSRCRIRRRSCDASTVDERILRPVVFAARAHAGVAGP